MAQTVLTVTPAWIPREPANVAALAIVVGIVMLVFGVLKFGSIMNFVSNAVMTGFTTGIALQIVAGVIGDATGYGSTHSNTLVEIGDWLIHPLPVAAPRPPWCRSARSRCGHSHGSCRS